MVRSRLGLLFPDPHFAAAVDPPAETVPEAVKSITARAIGGHLRFLASDMMKGRDTASSELRVAGEYLAAHLFGAGAEPLGDQGLGPRTFFQRFPLEVVTPREEGTELSLILELNGSRRVVPCKLGTDFVLFPRGIVPGEIEAPIVFAGYGRVDADKKIDDYAGLDVKNRFVLVYSGQPGAQASRPRARGPAHEDLCPSTFAKTRTGAEERSAGSAGHRAARPRITRSESSVERSKHRVFTPEHDARSCADEPAGDQSGRSDPRPAGCGLRSDRRYERAVAGRGRRACPLPFCRDDAK